MMKRLARHIFIRTQPTPNPQFLQFFPGTALLKQGSLDFPTLRSAQNYPLAVQLFNIDGVIRVFISTNYISIGKKDSFDWSIIKPLVFEALNSHVSSGHPVLEIEPNPDLKILETDSEDLALLKEVINSKIRPFLQDDGGDVKLLSFNEESGEVLLEMCGSCSGCPSSAVTLKNGIERMLKHYIKSVKHVRSIDG